MLADPQSVTINAVANSLPRTTSAADLGIFNNADGTIELKITHQTSKRKRKTIRLDVKKTAPDPLISAQNIVYSMSAYLVVDVPPTGYTVAEQKLQVDGLTAWLTASSGANLLKVLGGES